MVVELFLFSVLMLDEFCISLIINWFSNIIFRDFNKLDKLDVQHLLQVFVLPNVCF